MRETDVTPDERLEAAYDELREALQTTCSSESVLLQAMGYGRGQFGLAEVTGRSGDEGIDGVIREDRLGDPARRRRSRVRGTLSPISCNRPLVLRN